MCQAARAGLANDDLYVTMLILAFTCQTLCAGSVLLRTDIAWFPLHIG